MKQSYFTSPGFTFRLQPFGTSSALFLLFFLLNFTFGFGQGVTISSEEPNPTQNNPIGISIEFDERINGFEESDINVSEGFLSNFHIEWPDFEYTDVSKRLKDFEITINLNPFSGSTDFSPSSNSVIAIDIDESGFIYALTLDEGVFQYNPNGNLTSNNPLISADKFTEPRDLAIDDTGNIFIADSGADQVLKFDNDGGNMQVINSGLSSPSGLAVGPNQRIYVADTENNRVAIFNNNGTVAGEIDNGTGPEGLINPIRLAVDNIFNVYVTDAGNNRIQIYDSNGNHTGSLAGNSGNLNNPGSLVVDDYGFLYVADFVGVDLNTFLNFENIDESQILELVTNLENLRIQVFRVDDLSENPKTLKDAINIPIDLALKPCGYLAVNNGDATIEFEPNLPPRTYIEFIFDLKTYEILPTKFTAALEINAECIPAEVSINGEVGVDANCNSISASDEFSIIWDQTKPEVQTCYQEDQTVEMGDEIPNYGEEGLVVFEDNCEGNIEIEQTPAPGTEITQQTTTVRITATDKAGNVSDVCSFDLVVEEDDLFIDCPSDQIADFQGDCEFELPDYTGDANFTSGANVTQFPEAGTFITENTEITLTAALDGETKECTFTVETTNQRVDLAINCPGDQTETADANDVFEIPDYTDLANVENSCGAINVTQSPIEGTEVVENTTITLSVVDERGTSIDCTFEVILNFQDDLFIDCPVTQTADFEGDCEYELPDYTGDANFTSGANVTQSPEAGTFITENTEITLTAALDGETEECTFTVETTNQRPDLTISCSGDQTETADENDVFEIPDYTDLANVENSCGAINVTQSPIEGTEVDENTTVTLSVSDDRGVSVDCSFEVILNFQDDLFIDCPSDQIADFQGDCEFELPDYTGDANFTSGATVTQFPEAGTFITENTEITLTAALDGETKECTFTVETTNQRVDLAITCPGDQTETADANDVFEIPDYTDLANVENSCGAINVTQSPIEGTEVVENTTITLSVVDERGTSIDCTFEVILNFQDDLFIDCPVTQTADFEGNCEFELPDYNGDANFTSGATVTQSPEAGTFITENTEITLTVALDGETEECTFIIQATNQRADLAISCPNDQLESFDPDTGFEVPNYENMAGISDNCGEVSFRQEPAAGEIIYNNTTVNLFVEDEGGLEASCSFELELTEADVLNISCLLDKNVNPDDNCSFWLPDYTSNAEVNFPGADITQTPPVGTILTESTQIKLTASLNGETDECYFMVNLVDDQDPVANCVSGYVVNLDNNGTASITPEDLDNNSTDNCGIVSMALSQVDFTTADIGNVPVTLTVRDDAGNIDSCETTVEVRGEASGEFECRENIEVFLDGNGQANLNIQELYTGDASGLNLEASRLNFTCEDLGAAFIQLDYSGDETGSCTINVDVRDELPPEINTNLVELTLDSEGFAYLEESDISAEDNCSEELIYRFGKSVFTCKDVGMNSVNLEVEDINGNRSDKNIQVRISGEGCDLPEPGENEYLFLYPNPNNGIFTIATPEGMFIEQVRVFDSRGRYIMQQDYNANARFYRMTIQGVEESVYTLQIFTNEGVIVKRAIIKR
ncbi:T9SS type A sorting domain-containing protein [Salegentibacter sp. BDJ18]|uniref:T9SS type A sorting domain-containing protein n=1 Tax=Salegentibacter sp. BDJ18 TaxID=2816376 RepID=UPI001AAFBB8B|nr:T9SS type A sorting domain-containing protein [Salegentibacter sp. BDJ18]MBO2545874.1 T9SS type A sorting domain-containing protein [Salegentibacter sp. BDJ18]